MAPAGQRRAAPTITDVADGRRRRRLDGLAGVHAARTGSTTSTREHVLAVAERARLRAQPGGPALESGRTSTLALLVPDITNPYFAGVIKGAERAAAAAGLTLVLGDTQENPAHRGSSWSAASGPPWTGSCSAPPGCPTTSCAAAAELSPIALVNRATPGLACVVADFDSGTRQIVDHLASHGHRVVRLPRRAGRVLVGRPPLGAGSARPPSEHGLTATAVRALHAHARRGPGRGRRRAGLRGDRGRRATTTCSRSA